MIKYSVFILDDEPDSISRLQYLLKKYQVFRISGTETDPAKAIPLIRSIRPDILMLDIEMPGFSGFDILDKVKDSSYNPVAVFVTGFIEYALKAIRESAFDYILKPVDHEELDAVVNKILNYIPVKKGALKSVSDRLTDREQEIFELLRKGLTSRDIAEALNISKNTVDTHRRRILKRLELSSTTELILKYPLQG